MKIGDKVRLLRGTEEGLIVDIKNNKIVDIEIEEGFVIPALINEVVVIDSSEATSFRQDESEAESIKEEPKSNNAIAEGIYIGFDNDKPDELHGYIINQTKSTLLYTITQQDKRKYLGKAFGICKNYQAEHIGIFTPSIFNQSKRLLVELIFYDQETIIKKQPLTLECTISKAILANKTYIDSIAKEIAIINLNEDINLEIDARSLQEKMMETKSAIDLPVKDPFQKSGMTVDLHVNDDRADLSPNEILDHQLNMFEKAFDNALVMNCKDLKVIHGVGAGILRNEIHKRLSKKSTVKFFEDADKERFGFGSTLIYF